MSELIHPDIELLASNQPLLAMIVLIGSGILCCFFGYRATQMLLDIFGFLACGLAAMLAAGLFFKGNLISMGLALIIGGSIGAILAHLLYRMGLVLLGGGIALLLSWHFAELLPDNHWKYVAMTVAALSGGLFSFLLKRLTVSLATALLGGLFIVHGIFLFLEYFELEPTLPELEGRFQQMSPMLLAWALFSAIGLCFQLLFGKPKK